MPVVLLSPDGSTVVQLFMDVHSVGAAAAKYGLNASRLKMGNHPPGTKHVNGDFSAPSAPTVPVPATIKSRQLIIGMSLPPAQWITPAEAEAWSETNTLPQLVLDTINELPEAQRLYARITARKMTDVERANTLIDIAAALAMPNDTPEARAAAVDSYFREWAKI